jgi:hypothetical protein
VLGFVEDEEGRGAALVDQVQERLLEVGPQLGAPVGRPHAELGGEGTVEVQRRHRSVAQVQHEVVGPGQLGAEVADRGGLADAGVGGEDAQAGIGDELAEGTLQLFVAGALVEEGLAVGILGQRVAGESETLSVHDFTPPDAGGRGGAPTGRTRW